MFLLFVFVVLSFVFFWIWFRSVFWLELFGGFGVVFFIGIDGCFNWGGGGILFGIGGGGGFGG